MGDPVRSPSASSSGSASRKSTPPSDLVKSAINFSQQAEKLSHHNHNVEDKCDVAVEAHFVTPHDPVIITSSGSRLPGVPLKEAHKLNVLKEELEEGPHLVEIRDGTDSEEEIGTNENGDPTPREVLQLPTTSNGKSLQKNQDGSLRKQMPPSHTNPLFPPLPLYGPPSLLRDMQCSFFQVTSFFLSLAFLAVVVLGALFTSIPPSLKKVYYRLTFRNLDARRPFYEEEVRRRETRREMERTWQSSKPTEQLLSDHEGIADEYIPTEGGPDPIVCDVGCYARRVGLDVEEFQVQTEDGFIIDLWHVFDPKEYTKLAAEERKDFGPDVFTESRKRLKDPKGKRKFPVLLMHGLLQSAGAYCTNDDDSLAFYLCKSGYDVWLGNNRCGFNPKHVLLDRSDPRMWCWNIRQMGVFDLPALVSRVLYETGFEKLGLICHSQGTTETFVALAKEQRPDLGEKLTVFCALAPACYAGPLIGKAYFKFMRIITPAMFRMVFGIHSFISQMMYWHSVLNPRIYGWLGYKVFSFLFDWSDDRWDRGLKNRMFQFAPVYVSAESMRWWLGRECFARHKCILATKESVRAEEREDHSEQTAGGHSLPARVASVDGTTSNTERGANEVMKKPRGSTAWYNEQVPPFALWVAGNDDLVDGRKLLRRFERGREPHVNVVHSKVIEEYEHLDVIWAMDAPEQVFSEIREVLWKTCDVRDACRTPKGCEDVEPWSPTSGASEKGDTSEDEREQSSSSEER